MINKISLLGLFWGLLLWAAVTHASAVITNVQYQVVNAQKSNVKLAIKSAGVNKPSWVVKRDHNSLWLPDLKVKSQWATKIDVKEMKGLVDAMDIRAKPRGTSISFLVKGPIDIVPQWAKGYLSITVSARQLHPKLKQQVKMDVNHFPMAPILLVLSKYAGMNWPLNQGMPDISYVGHADSPRQMMEQLINTFSVHLPETGHKGSKMTSHASQTSPVASGIRIKVEIVQMTERAMDELGLHLKGSGGSWSSILNIGLINPTAVAEMSLDHVPGLGSLNLQLQALESEGDAKILSSFNLVVNNHQLGTIAQGQEIPYQSVASEGVSSVMFKKAVLGVEVKPSLKANGQVTLKVKVTKDGVSHDHLQAKGVPLIDTREMKTVLTLKTGQVGVMGGITEAMDQDNIKKIPGLSALPWIGSWFESHAHSKLNTQMIIFIQPRFPHVSSESTIHAKLAKWLDQQVEDMPRGLWVQ